MHDEQTISAKLTHLQLDRVTSVLRQNESAY